MKYVILLLAIMLLAVGCTTQIDSDFQHGSSSSGGESSTEPVDDPHTIDNVGDQNEIIVPNDEIQTLEDGTKYLIHPDDILRGIARPGDIKDVIPSIDDPKFVTVEEANEWIDDEQLVLAITHNGIDRAYPMQILVLHEIVNDNIGGDPVLITFCPLCGSGIAFEPIVKGEAVEFGTSGKLYNSNLVMYDRLTQTYWSQIDGRAIVGEMTGTELPKLDLDTVKWGEWKKEHPDTQVLSRDTGFIRHYGDDDGPYDGYYEEDYLIFEPDQRDDRIFAKDVIFGIEVDGVYAAIQESDIGTDVIEYEVNGVTLTIQKQSDGTVDIVRDDTGEIVPKERDFWFAWYAFHPETSLYEGG